MAKTNNDGFPITHPHLLEQWDWELNEGIDPYDIPAGSAKKYYWKCLNNEEHPSFLAAVNKRTRKLAHDKNHGCPICANRMVVPGMNDLASQYPDVAEEWDYEANFPLCPEEVPYASLKKVEWKCKEGHTWNAIIETRTRRGRGCPICSGKKIIPGVNDMATKHPELVAMLHPTMNGDFDPCTSAPQVNRKLYWQCPNNEEHVYAMTPGNVLRGEKCPYCQNRKVLAGDNDLQTTHPELIKEWDWEKNDFLPSEVTYGSKRTAHWKCKYGMNGKHQ